MPAYPSFSLLTLAPLALASVAFAMGLGVPAAARAEEPPRPRTVTVSAAGQVEAEPDIARISTGIVSEAKTARAALSANSTDMKKLIESIKASGIDPKDIQTNSFHVEPRYTNPREGEVAVINGYRVSNQVEVTIRDLDKVGDVLDSVVSLGANEVGGPTFEVSKAETLKDDARKEAVKNARRRAELFAAAAGVEVGEVLTITEEAGGYSPMPMARAAMAGNAPPIERGTQTLEARVTVTWALK